MGHSTLPSAESGVTAFGHAQYVRKIPDGASLRDRLFCKAAAQPNGCIHWMGALGRAGYGVLGFEGKTYKANRASWEVFRGPIPAGLHVLHRCDQPTCINPDHLFLGTQADNMADKAQKGRTGSRSEYRGLPRNKLSAHAVLAIRESTNGSHAVAREYSVHPSTIADIRAYRTWKAA